MHAVIPLIGLVGGPLVSASPVAGMSGLHDRVSLVAGPAAVPVPAGEMSLAVYLLVRGSRPSSPVLAGPRRPVPAVV